MTLSDRNLPVTGNPAAKMQPVALDNGIWKNPVPQAFSPLLDALNAVRKDSEAPGTVPAPVEFADSKNPTLKKDQGKVRWTLLLHGCRKALTQVLAVLTMGANKYSDGGWKKITCETDRLRYVDAMYRHLDAIAEHGAQSIDPESGLLHIGHVACNAMFLTHFAVEEAERQAREATR